MGDDSNVVELTKARPFKRGRKKTGGRVKGVRNKSTRIIKEAVLIAAEMEGDNGKGRGSLIGYLRTVARDDKRAFATLLNRAMGLQADPMGEVVVDLPYPTLEEARADLARRGIDVATVQRLLTKPIDLEAEDYEEIHP